MQIGLGTRKIDKAQKGAANEDGDEEETPMEEEVKEPTISKPHSAVSDLSNQSPLETRRHTHDDSTNLLNENGDKVTKTGSPPNVEEKVDLKNLLGGEDILRTYMSLIIKSCWGDGKA